MSPTWHELEQLRIPTLDPGSPEWLQVMTASKIPAVLGLSAYDSPYSLWQRMAGHVPPQPTNPTMDRGHYAELMLAAWWADQHPDLNVQPTATYLRAGWMGANPDRVITNNLHEVVGLLQIKASTKDWEWGAPGTDQVPTWVRAQIQWEMHTTGVRQCWVARDTGYALVEYLVPYDEDDALFIEGQARTFMDSLAADEPPSIADGHDETYLALRHLAPGIEDTTVELDDDTADLVLDHLAIKKQANHAENLAKAALAAAMGTARVAKHGDTVYATRQARKTGGDPYVVIAKGLLDKESIAA